MDTFRLEEAVRRFGEFRPQADSVHIPRELPEDVRKGSMGMGDLLLSDPEWAKTFVHEFTHHLQTTTTLSGIRLFHYYWTNRINMLSSLDEPIRKLLAKDKTLPQAVEAFRNTKAYHSSTLARQERDFKMFFRLYGYRIRSGMSTSSAGANGVRVSCRLDECQYAGLPELSIQQAVVTVEYPDGRYEKTVLGARHIRESCARVLDLMFVSSCFENERATTQERIPVESAASDPRITPYYVAFNLFFTHVRRRQFLNLNTFLIICELALMYDPVLAEYAYRVDHRGVINKFASRDEELAFWRRDIGPGVAFVQLIDVLNRMYKQLPSYNKDSDGEELYCRLAEIANIPLDSHSLDSALSFLDSVHFLFHQKDWVIFFNPTRKRIQYGLALRKRWLHKPILTQWISKTTEFLLDVVSVPVLTCYDNTVMGPTSDIDELTLLLFSELVSGILGTGKAKCLIKVQYPWMCKQARECTQGQEIIFAPHMVEAGWWCPYSKGLLVLQNWLSA